MKRLILTLLMATCAGQAAVDPQVTRAFEHFYNLEYDDAIRIFRQLLAKEPSVPNYHNHLAQAILYRELFHAGALESELVSGTNPFVKREKINASPQAVTDFEKTIGKSMELSQKRITANPNDVEALYAMGVAHGLRANFNFLVRKAWQDSLKDATAARKLHNQVVALDPNMTDARLIQGVHDYVVGSLPWHWKMLGFVAGFRGDREEGMKTLRLVGQKGSMNMYDAQVLLAAIYRREKKPQEALPLLTGLINRFPRNYLFRLETVQMYSDLGDKTKALEGLAKIEELKRGGTAGFASLPVEKIHYYRGNLLFWYKDFDRALEELKKATARPAGLDIHTTVMAWMRLGQVNDMKGRRNEALSAYKQAVAVAPESDAGKESNRYLSSPYRRT